jgi:hypothetical protein
VYTVVWLENLKGRDYSEDLDVDGKVMLEWNRVGECKLNLSGSEYGPVTGSSEHGNEPSDSIKGGEILD